MSRVGKLYGVGVGPGDPELLTLKAHRVLNQVHAIAYPACKAGAMSYASNIVKRQVPAETRMMGLLFPMIKDTEKLIPIWKESVEKIYEILCEGQDVAFITEGDPFFYSTFLHIYGIFKQDHPDVVIEVIPGVSSIMASSVVADWPLAVSDERMAILPATYEGDKLESALDQFDVICLMKISGVLDETIDLLARKSLLDKSVFVERAGSARERVVRDVGSLKGTKVNYLSLIIVKKVTVQCAGKL